MSETIFVHDVPVLSTQEEEANARFLANWSVTIQGTCVQVRRKLDTYNPLSSGNRKETSTFTWGARMRMLRFMNRINWFDHPPVLFVTLTYPDELADNDYKLRSKQRYLFHRYVEKYLGVKVPMVWRVEWKVRQSGLRKGRLAPHWHLLLLTESYLPHEQVREWWRRILGYTGEYLMTDVHRVTGHQGAIRYVAKYTCKSPSLDISPYHNSGVQKGRHWGVCRKKMIPMCVQRTFNDLDDNQIKALQAYGRSRNKRYDELGSAGFTALGEDPVKLVEEILKKS